MSLAFAICWAACFGTNGRADESVEPPVKYSIVIDGKTIELTENVEQTIEGEFQNPKITLQAGNVRHFPHGGVEFDYPKHMAWEADLGDPDMKEWTLDGNDVVILFFLTAEEVTPDSFADQMIAQFGKRNCKISPLEHSIGARKFQGVRTRVKVGPATIDQRCIVLPKYQDKYRLLVLQDSLTDEGEPSAESKLVDSMLEKTFELRTE